MRSEKLKQIRELLGIQPRESGPPPAPLPDNWNGDTDAKEAQAKSGDEAEDADEPTSRRCRSCGEGRFLLIGQTPRPTVAEFMQMSPTMEPRADSIEVQLHLPLSAFV